jgi:hypothetical protein
MLGIPQGPNTGVSLPSPEDWNRSISETLCFLVILNSGRLTKSKTYWLATIRPVIEISNFLRNPTQWALPYPQQTAETDPDLETFFVVRRMPSSGMLRCVALVRIDISEEVIASIIRVTGIGVLRSVLRLLVTTNVFLDWRVLSPDDGGDTFLRIICSYKSRTA